MSTAPNADEPQRKISTFRMIGRILSFARPYWPWLALTAFLYVFINALIFAIPYLTGWAVDDITAARYDRLWWFGLLTVLAAVAGGLLTLVRTWVQTYGTGHAMWDMRAFLFESLQRLSISYHERESSGQIISRAIEDINQVEGFYRMVLFTFVEIAIVFFTAVSLMFYRNWQLALWSLSTLPLAAVLTVVLAGRVRLSYFNVQQQEGKMTTVLQENISGVRVVRGFAQETPQLAKFNTESHGIISTVMNAVKLWTTHGSFIRFLVVVAGAATFPVGAWMVAQRSAAIASGVPPESAPGVTVGTVVFFFFLQAELARRFLGLGRLVSNLQRAVASGDRVFEVLDLVPEIVEKPDAIDFVPGPGRVEFQHVSFSYDSGKPVLVDLNLVVEPGSLVALVGATGSGKSTFASLLPRFYDVSSGRILIDGVDLRDVTLRSLRRSVGLVFQESFLFSARVVDNIAFGNPEADIDEVRRAAAQARADEFIDLLPKGYFTLIGERGLTLSGGQRQRIAIARTILPNPRILVLDDSTSSVDPATEREIHDTMMSAARNRTTFVIAHRLSTVRGADLIVVLDHGRIAETGTHAQLLALGGLYRAIYDMQFRDDESRLSPNGSFDTPRPGGNPS